jgi:hypothetical protein
MQRRAAARRAAAALMAVLAPLLVALPFGRDAAGRSRPCHCPPMACPCYHAGGPRMPCCPLPHAAGHGSHVHTAAAGSPVREPTAVPVYAAGSCGDDPGAASSPGVEDQAVFAGLAPLPGAPPPSRLAAGVLRRPLPPLRPPPTPPPRASFGLSA